MDADGPSPRKNSLMESCMNEYSFEEHEKDTKDASYMPSPAASLSPTGFQADESSARNGQIPGRSDGMMEGLGEATSANGLNVRRSHRSPPPRESVDGTTNDHSTESSTQTSYKSLDKMSEKLAQKDGILKLPASKIQELTSSPESLPLHPAPEKGYLSSSSDQNGRCKEPDQQVTSPLDITEASQTVVDEVSTFIPPKSRRLSQATQMNGKLKHGNPESVRPSVSSRTVSTPALRNRKYSSRKSDEKDDINPSARSKRNTPTPLQLDTTKLLPSSRSPEQPTISPDQAPSPMPRSMPLPPPSLPTYLQLELSSSRPSPLYIYRSSTSDFPYESSKIKFERLLNFLLLPPQLEQVLWFGALACLDSWLYCFTILPLRFIIALGVLGRWWALNMVREARQLSSFVYWGLGRMWTRSRNRKEVASTITPNAHERQSLFSKVLPNGETAQNIRVAEPPILDDGTGPSSSSRLDPKRPKISSQRHRRSKSTPSALLPDHKADLLKGLVVLFSCLLLMRFDASRMYHGIRGQAAIKLYVIYNVLEVCDRLFSALGQDVFECLFSRETLERKPDGRSKVLRPFGMFLLALSYNVIHSTALFYQVITLNVAVNSYSNALLTLLMSNQFVEIKSTVFKKFEKENLFQLTCADVVERFQLWLMLMIIALRNIVEMGGFSLGGSSTSISSSSGLGANVTRPSSVFGGTLVPKSFTIFPKWTGQVFGPFLLVLGSEMLVDWLKHAYITKFNNTKPAIYGRFLDVLAKDYYSNAFSDQNLTRRLGLPVIPLSCLFIRASLQTYHMFLATNVPLPIPSTATSLSVDSTSTTSPANTAALQHFDAIIRRALGRSSFGAGGDPATGSWWSADDVIAFVTMLIFFLGVFFVLLALKLVLGMLLLGFARSRYKGMKEREKEGAGTGGRRIGGWGVVEVDDDKKRWIYQDDPEGARASREREKAMRDKQDKGNDFSGVSRYTMAAKRIW